MLNAGRARTRCAGPACPAAPSGTTPYACQLFALAYNLANFLRSLVLPKEVAQWSLTTLREKLVKIGALKPRVRVVSQVVV